MSTRCQIGFYEQGQKDLAKWEALIYRHIDGYPDGVDGVSATIVPILKDFNKDWGLSNIEYASAWLVAKLKTDYRNIGICSGFHDDIDYFYAIYPDRLEVYKTLFDSKPALWKLLDTIELKG